MRPRPLCTEQYLKDVSTALRQGQEPQAGKAPRIRGAYPEWIQPILGFALLACGLCLLFWLVSLLPPRFGEPKRELIDSTTHFREAVQTDDFLERVVGQWYYVKLPDGKDTRVWARYMGALAQGQVLQHADIGDEWYYNGNLWIWMIPAGKAVPEWVDP